MTIGMLIDAYEKFPEKDNTIVVLWSDHGYVDISIICIAGSSIADVVSTACGIYHVL
jgi:arylsulfatase A-like enzyme